MTGSRTYARVVPRVAAAILVLALTATCGGDRGTPREAAPQDAQASTGAPSEERWSCVMHPQIHASEPGRCPICGMELVRVGAPDEESFPSVADARLRLSEAAIALAEIRTTRVEPRPTTVEVRLSGRLAVDERRMRDISAYVPGRLERLYVDFTGVEVRSGQPLLQIYSPELVSAQEELLQSLRASEATRESSLESLRRSTEELLEAAREKLRLLGLSAQQIRRIEETRKTQTRVTIHSPLTGIVMHKSGVEGMYVQTGTHIYSVADLSQLWAQLDAYESDLPWLEVGQDVTFTTQAVPGTEFQGRVAFIDPVLDPTTRTVGIRVDVPNPEGHLKPGLYVRATLESGIRDGTPPLAIPATAPLITGRRAVVYVREPDAETPTFEGREIVLGPRAGDWYVVASGLQEGEMVVSQGAFKIDSALQIQAKPSMMQPEGLGDRPTPRSAPSRPGSSR